MSTNFKGKLRKDQFYQMGQGIQERTKQKITRSILEYLDPTFVNVNTFRKNFAGFEGLGFKSILLYQSTTINKKSITMIHGFLIF